MVHLDATTDVTCSTDFTGSRRCLQLRKEEGYTCNTQRKFVDFISIYDSYTFNLFCHQVESSSSRFDPGNQLP
jgi:hypothetical protein